MSKKQPHGIGSLARQPEVLVDDVEMVERQSSLMALPKGELHLSTMQSD